MLKFRHTRRKPNIFPYGFTQQGSVFWAIVENIINLQLLGWTLGTNIGNSISLPGTCPTPLRIFRELFSASHLPVQSPARLRLIVFFVLSVGLFGPPWSLVWISSHPSFGLLLIFLGPPLSFLAASFKLLLLSFQPLLNLLWASFGSPLSLLWASCVSPVSLLWVFFASPLSLLCVLLRPRLSLLFLNFLSAHAFKVHWEPPATQFYSFWHAFFTLHLWHIVWTYFELSSRTSPQAIWRILSPLSLLWASWAQSPFCYLCASYFKDFEPSGDSGYYNTI